MKGPCCSNQVSLTNLIVEDSLSLTVLTKSTAVSFFAENCEELFHCKSYPYFFCINVFKYSRLSLS